jgi:predicted DNA-binding transcriptional regulator YafY
MLRRSARILEAMLPLRRQSAKPRTESGIAFWQTLARFVTWQQRKQHIRGADSTFVSETETTSHPCSKPLSQPLSPHTEISKYLARLASSRLAFVVCLKERGHEAARGSVMKTSRKMLVRQWRLALALSSSRFGMTIEQLKHETEQSRSNVYRDLEVLRDAGAPITSEIRNGEARYRFLRGAELPAMTLTTLQVTALHLARAELEPLAGTGVVSELDALLASLRPVEAQQALRFPPQPAGRPQILKVMERAMHSRQRVRIEYRAASRQGAPSTVCVEPLLLSVSEGDPYLRAFCVERNGERTYKIARIANAELTAERSTYKPEHAPEHAFRDSVKAWTGPPSAVQIKLDPSVAWRASEYRLVPNQKITKQKDGAAIVEARVSGIVEATQWVLAWGGAAEALEPAELREAVRVELEKALEKYQSGPGPVKARREKSVGRQRGRVAHVGTRGA